MSDTSHTNSSSAKNNDAKNSGQSTLVWWETNGAMTCQAQNFSARIAQSKMQE
jgi:hypothetical protein